MSHQHPASAAAPSALPGRRRKPQGIRVPAFEPVAIRESHNAFVPRLQAHYIGFLAESGSVAFACAQVGKSRMAAYRLRKRRGSESFCAAWDAALGLPVARVTPQNLDYLAYHGPFRLRFKAGRYCGFRQVPSAAALLRLAGRFDRLCDRIAARCDTPGQISREVRNTGCDTPPRTLAV